MEAESFCHELFVSLYYEKALMAPGQEEEESLL
jgi:hypothetical protein